jgi:hypothetical protein
MGRFCQTIQLFHLSTEVLKNLIKKKKLVKIFGTIKLIRQLFHRTLIKGNKRENTQEKLGQFLGKKKRKKQKARLQKSHHF